MGRINIYKYTLNENETFLNILNGNYITRISDGKLNIKNIKIEDLTGLTATPIIDSDQQNTGNSIKFVKLFYHETYKKDITPLDFIEEIDSIDILSGLYKHTNPVWTGYADPNIFNIPYLSPFCLIFIKIKTKGYAGSICYVISYGSGYLVLDRSKAIVSFGREIVRKLVEEDGITEMRQISPLQKGRLTVTAINSGGNLSEHTYDKMTAIPTGISGRVDKTKFKEPANQPINSRGIIQGNTNFSCLLSEIGERTEHIKNIINAVNFLEELNDKDSGSLSELNYQEQVKNSDDIKKLNKVLYQKISSGSSSEIFITPPLDIRKLDTEDKTFSLYLNNLDHKEEIDDWLSLSINRIKEFMKKYIKSDGDKPVKIIMEAQNSDSKEKNIEYSSKITNWLSAVLEFPLKGGKKEIYWLVDGMWYRISVPFLQELDKYFTDIEKEQGGKYPIFNRILKNTVNCLVNNSDSNFPENKYNAYLAKNISQEQTSEFHEGINKALILDIGNVYNYGIHFYNTKSNTEKPNELADIFIADGTYIHVKNYTGGSQGISHLVSQSLLSTRWLIENRESSIEKIHDHYFDKIDSSSYKIQNYIEKKISELENDKRKIKTLTETKNRTKKQSKDLEKLLKKQKNKPILDINKTVCNDFIGNNKIEEELSKIIKIKRVVLVILYNNKKPLTNLGKASLYQHIQKLKEYGIEVDILFSKANTG